MYMHNVCECSKLRGHSMVYDTIIQARSMSHIVEHVWHLESIARACRNIAPASNCQASFYNSPWRLTANIGAVLCSAYMCINKTGETADARQQETNSYLWPRFTAIH